MILQPDEGPEGQPDVVALPAGGSDFATFDSGELLDAAMVLFDRPGEFGEDQPPGFDKAEFELWDGASGQTGCGAASVADRTRGSPISNWMEASPHAQARFMPKNYTPASEGALADGESRNS